MTTDVKMFYQHGHKPLLLTQDRDLVNSVTTTLDSYNIFGRERSVSPLRKKVVETARGKWDLIQPSFNGNMCNAKKVITRTQVGTNNMTKIIDFMFENTRGVELTRDLPNGETLNLVMKKGKDGIGEVLKFTTSNGLGRDLTAVTKNFGKLDPLAKKWIKEALKYLF